MVPCIFFPATFSSVAVVFSYVAASAATVTRSDAALAVTANGPAVKLLLPHMRPAAGCELFSTRAAAAALAAACAIAFLLRMRFFAPGLGLGPGPIRAPPLPPPWARPTPGMSREK